MNSNDLAILACDFFQYLLYTYEEFTLYYARIIVRTCFDSIKYYGRTTNSTAIQYSRTE